LSAKGLKGLLRVLWVSGMTSVCDSEGGPPLCGEKWQIF